jgi:hypothetical protein
MLLNVPKLVYGNWHLRIGKGPRSTGWEALVSNAANDLYQTHRMSDYHSCFDFPSLAPARSHLS